MARWKSFKRKLSTKKYIFIQDRMLQLMGRGCPKKQALRIAYDEARKKGYKIKRRRPTETYGY